MEGQGILKHSNGTVYEGQWKNGKREGQGIMKNKDGKMLQQGKWRENGGKMEGK
jgi:hypothetical protein